MIYDKENASVLLQSTTELNDYLTKYKCDDLETLQAVFWNTYESGKLPCIIWIC